MMVVFELNIVTMEYGIIAHNIQEIDVGTIAMTLTNLGIPSVALHHGGTHYNIGGATTCRKCINIIEQHLGLNGKEIVTEDLSPERRRTERPQR